MRYVVVPGLFGWRLFDKWKQRCRPNIYEERENAQAAADRLKRAAANSMTKANKHLLLLGAAAVVVWALTRRKPAAPGDPTAGVTPVSIWRESGELKTRQEVVFGESLPADVERLRTDAAYRTEQAEKFKATRLELYSLKAPGPATFAREYMKVNPQATTKGAENVWATGVRALENAMADIWRAFGQADLARSQAGVESYIGAREPVIVKRET